MSSVWHPPWCGLWGRPADGPEPTGLQWTRSRYPARAARCLGVWPGPQHPPPGLASRSPPRAKKHGTPFSGGGKTSGSREDFKQNDFETQMDGPGAREPRSRRGPEGSSAARSQPTGALSPAPALTSPQGPGHTWSQRLNAQATWPWHNQIATSQAAHVCGALLGRTRPALPCSAGPRPRRGFPASKHASYSSMGCHFPLIQIHNVCSSLKT